MNSAIQSNEYIPIEIYSNRQSVKKALNWLLVVILISLIVSAVISTFSSDTATVSLDMISTLPVCFSFFLVQQEKFELAATFLTIVLITFATVSATLGLGIHHISVMAYVLILMVSSLFVRPKVLIALTLISLACVAWLVFGELFGIFYIGKFQRSVVGDFFTVSLIIVIAISIVRALTNMLVKSHLQLKEELSKREVAEAGLRQSGRRLQALIENGLDFISLLDVNGNLLWENPSSNTMLGYRFNQFLGKSIFEVMHPDDLEWTKQKFSEVAKRPGGRHDGVFRLRSVDGEWHWVDATVTNLLQDPAVEALVVNYRDITERKQADDKLAESQVRFSAIFYSSPIGISITHLDGRFLDANDAFCKLLGYSQAELLGYTSLELNLWVNLDQREKLLQLLRDMGDVHNIEAQFKRKDGEILDVILGGEFIELNGEQYLLTLLLDITDRKRAENITQARLRISDYAVEHTLDELLQNSVDELCALTSSPIGFFHFVEPDQRTLSLQAWSTYTLREMCTTKGKGQHYDIEQAGVWADCARLRVPIIHNDYASLLERKGLPEGHAPIFREMVYPILRDQKIVAIIGVGNKAQDYTESDVAYASRLADLIWDITERKKAEEAEHEQRTLAEALRNSAAALTSTLDFGDVLDRILDNVGRVVFHDSVGIFLLDEMHQSAQIVAYRDGREQPGEMKGQKFLIAETRDLREMLATGEPVIIPETSKYDGWVTTAWNAWIHATLSVSIKIRGKIVGFLYLYSAQPDAFTPPDAERLRAFVDHAAIAIENAWLYEEIQKLALTDPLTGIFNRTYFETELTRMELGRDFPVSIIIGDLDNLKITNDTLGHAAGDELLKGVAQVLRDTFRAGDIIARVGGDEFAVLLPKTDSATAEQMLLRIEAKLAEYNSGHPDGSIPLSLGTSTAEQGKLMEAFNLADKRMYTNKAARKLGSSQS